MRRHSAWLWWVIIAAIIITFVVWGSQTGNQGGGGSGDNLGTVYGKRITPDQFLSVEREVALQFFFNYGSWPDQDAKRMGFDVEQQTFFRMLLIEKQKELGIHPGEESAVKLGQLRLRQLSRGEPVPLDAFVTQVLRPRGLTTADFARYLDHELGIQEIISLTAAGAQMVTPEEARALYTREHEEMAVSSVFFSGSNYLSRVTVTPQAFNQFYTNQMARYHLPERVQVDYVEFHASNFMAEATAEFAKMTNLEEQIETTYERYGTNFMSDAKSPAEAKSKIRQLMLEEQALLVARKKANEFANNLNDIQPARTGNLAKLAAEKGLKVQTSEPFNREEPPAALKVNVSFNKAAFALNADEPFTGPLVGGDAVYEIELKQRLPAENPPLAKIRDEVMADCKQYEAIQQARLAGADFLTGVTNGLAKGKTFAAICTQDGVTPVNPPPFSLSTRALSAVEEHTTLNLFKQAVFGTPVGRVSPLVPTSEGGFLVFVRAKLPVDQAQLQADLPTFMAQVRQSRQHEAFNGWLNREIATALRDTPVNRQQPPAPGAAPEN